MDTIPTGDVHAITVLSRHINTLTTALGARSLRGDDDVASLTLTEGTCPAIFAGAGSRSAARASK